MKDQGQAWSRERKGSGVINGYFATELVYFPYLIVVSDDPSLDQGSSLNGGTHIEIQSPIAYEERFCEQRLAGDTDDSGLRRNIPVDGEDSETVAGRTEDGTLSTREFTIQFNVGTSY